MDENFQYIKKEYFPFIDYLFINLLALARFKKANKHEKTTNTSPTLFPYFLL